MENNHTNVSHMKAQSHFSFYPLPLLIKTKLQVVVVEIYPYEMGHPFENVIRHQSSLMVFTISRNYVILPELYNTTVCTSR